MLYEKDKLCLNIGWTKHNLHTSRCKGKPFTLFSHCREMFMFALSYMLVYVCKHTFLCDGPFEVFRVWKHTFIHSVWWSIWSLDGLIDSFTFIYAFDIFFCWHIRFWRIIFIFSFLLSSILLTKYLISWYYCITFFIHLHQ